MSEKLGQESAFPESYEYGDENQYTGHRNGMSKRFYAACAAMQGLLSQAHDDHPQMSNMEAWNYEIIAKCAFKAADELLKQENQE